MFRYKWKVKGDFGRSSPETGASKAAGPEQEPVT